MKNSTFSSSSSSITPLYTYSPQSSPISEIFDKNVDEIIIKEKHLLKHSSINYERIKVVGKGSFGIAVLYKRKDDESFVILKEINLHELNNSERQMALNEVNLLSRLDHPHIIAFYDSFEEDGTLMIEMEYADGGTLSQLLANLTEPLIETEAIDMFEQMVSAVSYLHDHDILHRKMSNETKINGSQTILGTPYYLSPEMCEGKPYNEKSDIWALGCCFYEMCSLNKAFDADNLPKLLNKIINSEYEPLKKNYSQEVRLLIREMLRILPQQRPTSSQLLDQVRYLCSSKEKKITKITKNNNFDKKIFNEINSFSALYAFDILNGTLSSVQEFPKRIKIKQIAVSESHQLILTIQGQVFSWGDNSFGQLGHGDKEDIIDICCGDEHAIALTEKGEIFVWGKGKNGQLGTGNRNDVFVPIRIQIPTRQLIKSIICGPDSTMLITNSGTLLAMGSNKYNKLNKQQIVEDFLLPTAVRPFPRRVVSASLGNNHSGVLLENGHVHLFGLNSSGELGTGNTLPISDCSRPVKALINKACLHLICGDGFTVVGTLDNELYFWGLRGGGGGRGEKEENKIIKENNKPKVRAFRMAKTQEGWQLSATESVNITILQPILVLRLDVCNYNNSLNNRSNIELAGLVCSSKRVFCIVDVANEQIEKLKEEQILSINQNKIKISRRKSAPDNLSLSNTTETWIRDELDNAEFIPLKPQKLIKNQKSFQLLESEQKLREEIIQLRKQLQEQKNTFNGHEKQMSQLQAKLAELKELINKQKEIEGGGLSYLPPINIPPPPEYPGKKLKSSQLKNTFVNKNVTKACNII
uniref:non-specific serine/threonine protein kinase n=1 Tax=Meloidogyne hapla TaxID=6305 RepID=A0A1I8AWB2_MELHA